MLVEPLANSLIIHTYLKCNILHCICCQVYLDAVISLRPSLLHLGDKGLLLLIRFLSTPNGFTFLQDANFVTTQLERWASSYNYR
jgi:rapamycin-insensitive companion of mTOR